MRNLLTDLADLFDAAARVLRDPDVQETGQRFLVALDHATDRELAAPVLQALTERIDGP